jgi:microcin C transport system substrate-binding protein
VVGRSQGSQDGIAPVKLTRRDTLVLGAGAVAATVVPCARLAQAQEEVESHGMSAFGDLKYPADFKHFDYVNPDAPKGGMFSQVGPGRQFNQNFLTFNSLNAFILKGDGAQGIDRTFATLMAPSTVFAPTHDEPDAVYGFAARAVRTSADGLTYRFLLRPEAKFHDGTRLTAHDVAFTLALLKDKGHPIIQQQLRDFAGAEAVDDATVVARFAPGRARDVPLFVATLPIFSRAYYTSRPFDESTLEVPLGSGAYKVGRFDAGHFIEYDRVKDWWGAELPVWRGLNNFDVLRYEYFRERETGFQAFTSKTFLFQEEFTSRFWATRYDFPAIKDGRVKRDVIPDDTPSGAQGWFINTRRDRFQDPRFREALSYAFDFEWTNKNIMYGSYERAHSIFQNSNMMAVGKPGPEELALLEPFRGQVSDEVFGEPFVPPVSDGSGQDRTLLRKATALLRSAGFVLKDGKLMSPKGERVTIEFLIDEPTFQPHHLPYIKNLGVLGIEATLRIVDAVQYRARVDGFDFDITVERMQFSSTPGDGLRPFFSSQAAATKGSQNLAGIADPVIDAMIERIVAATTRPELVNACKALDRVFRAGRYWVPHWYKPTHWIAYWDVFGRPATKPRYGRGIPDTWWYDRDKAAKIERAG